MPTISDVQSLQKETLIKTDMKHLDDQGQRSSIRGPLKFSRTVCFKISGIHGSSLVLLCLVFGESSYAIAFAFSLPRRADSRQMCFFNLWKWKHCGDKRGENSEEEDGNKMSPKRRGKERRLKRKIFSTVGVAFVEGGMAPPGVTAAWREQRENPSPSLFPFSNENMPKYPQCLSPCALSSYVLWTQGLAQIIISWESSILVIVRFTFLISLSVANLNGGGQSSSRSSNRLSSSTECEIQGPYIWLEGCTYDGLNHKVY